MKRSYDTHGDSVQVIRKKYKQTPMTLRKEVEELKKKDNLGKSFCTIKALSHGHKTSVLGSSNRWYEAAFTYDVIRTYSACMRYYDRATNTFKNGGAATPNDATAKLVLKNVYSKITLKNNANTTCFAKVYLVRAKRIPPVSVYPDDRDVDGEMQVDTSVIAGINDNYVNHVALFPTDSHAFMTNYEIVQHTMETLHPGERCSVKSGGTKLYKKPIDTDASAGDVGSQPQKGEYFWVVQQWGDLAHGKTTNTNLTRNKTALDYEVQNNWTYVYNSGGAPIRDVNVIATALQTSMGADTAEAMQKHQPVHNSYATATA